MRVGILGFLLGVVVLQQLPELPSLAWAISVFIVVPVAIHWHSLRVPAWMCGGFVWALLRAHMLLDVGGVVPETEGVDVVLTGVVASMPIRKEFDIRFQMDVERIEAGGQERPSPGRIRLSWRNPPPDIAVGDRWQLQVRLKAPHGFMNPGGFDYESWLYRQGIRATGYVRSPQKRGGENSGDDVDISPKRLERLPTSHPFESLRQSLAARIGSALQDAPHGAIVAALAIGTTHDFSQAQWDVFNRTGTTHLVSISGLHIGIVASLAFFLGRFLWSRGSQTPLWWPAPKAGAVAAILAAVIYAGLAGFSVPTQRALVMVAVAMAALLLQRNVRASDVLALSLLAVLFVDPLSVLQAGFWLSFGAVAVILLAATSRIGAPSWWARFGALQWVVAVGLMPLVIVIFARASLVAPVANLIAVPWFSFITVPLSLAGAATITAVEPVGAGLLHLAEWSVVPVWTFLDALAQLPAAQWAQHAPKTWTIALAMIGAAWLISPRGFPARGVGAVMLLPMMFVPPASPQRGEFWLTLLDVGQGLSAVVKTEAHVLVYDTGPRLSPSFDTGDAVVAPFLRYEGIHRINRLILSHSDGDHVGGTQSVLENFPVDDIVSSVPIFSAPGAIPCVSPTRWTWDDVDFELIHPIAEERTQRHRDNDVSCVLKIHSRGGAVLLTGDIEARSEHELLGRNIDALAADVLVVPHHGSATSSTEEFVKAVNPRFALFPAGYRNRFGFPKPVVTARYQRLGARQYDTGSCGAITVPVLATGIGFPECYRRSAGRYWTHRPDEMQELKD